MGMQVGGDKKGPMADINVTPFVDVCLVLLIIFMVIVVVTMMQLGYMSKLPPRTPSDPNQPPPADQIVIRLSNCPNQGQISACKVFVNRDEVPVSQLVPRCRQLAQGRSMQMIFFTAEDNVNYENVLKILDLIHEGGLQNVAVLTESIAADSLIQ
jgi:biopolymer transport protein TolR